MSRKSIHEVFGELYERYHQASKALKRQILDQVCAVTRLHRKSAIRKLNGPPSEVHATPKTRVRGTTYSREMIEVLTQVWDAAGYPCGVRLKALVSLWLPKICERFSPSPTLVRQLLAISARQMDRRLKAKKTQLKKRLYGRTKPGTLLKHHIPIKTDHWNVKAPGFAEMDTVAHCGHSADGEFAHTVNQTDILTTWVESRAVLGKGERAVVAALDEMAGAFPFAMKGYDSDNGSEFINWHLLRYCQQKGIQPTRSRPYKKDDNAHIEQKNWTHVRKLFGWDRYDTAAAVAAMNTLYRQELSQFMNLFLPAMKLVKKVRVGSRLTRQYDTPQTPLDRVIACGQGDPVKVAAFLQLRNSLDPFTLSAMIDKKLAAIRKVASQRVVPAPPAVRPPAKPLTPGEEETLRRVARLFGAAASVREGPGHVRHLEVSPSQ